MTGPEHLNFVKKSHWAFNKSFVTQEYDELTGIWKITTVHRNKDGYPVGKIRTAFYIGDEPKMYKNLFDVLNAYNEKEVPA